MSRQCRLLNTSPRSANRVRRKIHTKIDFESAWLAGICTREREISAHNARRTTKKCKAMDVSHFTPKLGKILGNAHDESFFFCRRSDGKTLLIRAELGVTRSNGYTPDMLWSFSMGQRVLEGRSVMKLINLTWNATFDRWEFRICFRH